MSPGTDSGTVPGKVPGTYKLIKAGTFTMGSRKDEVCKWGTQEERHQVTLTRDFEISTTEVTQAQFRQVMGYNPSQFSGTDTSKGGSYCGSKSTCDNNPVDSVYWREAAAYCNKLSTLAGGLAPCYDCTGSGGSVKCTPHWEWIRSGKTIHDCPGYRLPTDAEWEYAYRAGTTSALYNGETTTATCWGCDLDSVANAVAWYCGNSQNPASGGRSTHPVGAKMPNPWGLFDMSGNLHEWIDDWYVSTMPSQAVKNPWNNQEPTGAGREKVIRGGDYTQSPAYLRGAHRKGQDVTHHQSTSGFRCLRSIIK